MFYTTTKVMLEIFLSYIDQEKLFSREDKLLVAVSGGMDSMVLLALLIKGGFSVMAAHVNHKMRGEDSDADSRLVSQYCVAYGIPFELLEVDPDTWEKTGNFQQMARKIRYEWLEKTAAINGCRYILTAHHADDAAETFLLHAVRGSGLGGLRGIPAKRENIIRPLLPFSRTDIKKFAEGNNIPFREDASNQSPKYSRNRIRNEVLPLLASVDPRARAGLGHTIRNLTEENDLLHWLADQWFVSHRRVSSDDTILELTDLPDGTTGSTLLFYLVRRFGFTHQQAIDILEGSGTGALFHSPSHMMLRDRNTILIRHLSAGSSGKTEFPVNPPAVIRAGNFLWQFMISDYRTDLEFDPGCQYLDMASLVFPLMLRLWQPGDRMTPLGMGGRSRKIQDILTDKKIPRLDKNRTMVIISGRSIVAIPGICISEHVKISSATRQIMEVRKSENY